MRAMTAKPWTTVSTTVTEGSRATRRRPCSTSARRYVPVAGARALVEHVFRAAGYRLSASHTNPQALKTDAPQAFVWALLKQWAVVGRGVVRPPAPGARAAPRGARPPADPRIDLDAAEKAPRPAAPREKRFLPNPAPHWGPGSRAGRKTTPAEKAERKKLHRAQQRAEAEKGSGGDDSKNNGSIPEQAQE